MARIMLGWGQRNERFVMIPGFFLSSRAGGGESGDSWLLCDEVKGATASMGVFVHSAVAMPLPF